MLCTWCLVIFEGNDQRCITFESKSSSAANNLWTQVNHREFVAIRPLLPTVNYWFSSWFNHELES